jgi:transglutaminase-like putative cysteine protease
MDTKHTIYKAKSLGLLVAGTVMTVAWAISATGWVKRGLDIIIFVGLGSILIGMMLARSILPGTIAHLFSIIIGIGWSFWMTSRLFPANYTWLARWEDLVVRLNRWYDQAIQGGVSHDNLMFILQMAVIVWGMGYLTIWFLFRSGKVWQAIVPGGLVLIINLYYAPNDITIWFLIYVLLSLLLVIRFNLFKQEIKWRTEGIFFQPDIGFEFLRDGLIFSIIIIALAWITPPAATETPGLLDEFQGTWQELQGNWNRLYADLNYRNPGQVGTFGQSLTLGGPRHLTDEPVMDVKLEGGGGRYWRATVYDQYTGGGWRNTDLDRGAFGPRPDLSLPIFAARQPVTQTFTFYHDGSTALYAMSNPVRLDRSAKVTFNAISGKKYSLPIRWLGWTDSEGPRVEEITYIRSNAAVDKGESYQVVSAVSWATIEQLKEAHTDYPTWVAERYLKLPDTVTERTRQLARELTEPFDNPFSKAQAIERYLRTEIKYNERISTPPLNVDKVDYILFDLKEAYCDYYASSMIVMLRSVGIPARLAAGFAQGDYDAERDVYQVLNADAHSWVEVYFPQYGWVEFEPTAAQPSIVRLTGPATDDAFADSGLGIDNLGEGGLIPGKPEELLTEEEPIGGELPLIFNMPWFDTQISLPRGVVKRGITFTSIALLVGLATAGFWWYRQQTRAIKNIFDLYQSMVNLASWMGAAIRPWQTPYEHAGILKRRLPTYEREVETITTEYVHQTFSPPRASSQHDTLQGIKSIVESRVTYQSNLAWRRLRPEMIKTAIKRRLPW